MFLGFGLKLLSFFAFKPCHSLIVFKPLYFISVVNFILYHFLFVLLAGDFSLGLVGLFVGVRHGLPEFSYYLGNLTSKNFSSFLGNLLPFFLVEDEKTGDWMLWLVTFDPLQIIVLLLSFLFLFATILTTRGLRSSFFRQVGQRALTRRQMLHAVVGHILEEPPHFVQYLSHLN